MQIHDNSKQNNRTDSQSILSATATNLININNFVKQLIFWIVFIFIIGGALIVINAIQLTIFTRRNEIFIMRLVGATPSFIRLPFLTEGISYAIISVCLSFILLFIAGQALGLENLQLIKENNSINLINIFLAELGLAILLSLISSMIAVEKYLRGQLTYN
jgi:cell division transport system permease protein